MYPADDAVPETQKKPTWPTPTRTTPTPVLGSTSTMSHHEACTPLGISSVNNFADLSPTPDMYDLLHDPAIHDHVHDPMPTMPMQRGVHIPLHGGMVTPPSPMFFQPTPTMHATQAAALRSHIRILKRRGRRLLRELKRVAEQVEAAELNLLAATNPPYPHA